MKNSLDDIFINNIPTLDLHGEIRSSARVLIKEFVYDNYVLKNRRILIIHGVGTGALKNEVSEVLKINKMVESFHLNSYNQGCTIVYLKKYESSDIYG